MGKNFGWGPRRTDDLVREPLIGEEQRRIDDLIGKGKFAFALEYDKKKQAVVTEAREKVLGTERIQYTKMFKTFEAEIKQAIELGPEASEFYFSKLDSELHDAVVHGDIAQVASLVHILNKYEDSRISLGEDISDKRIPWYLVGQWNHDELVWLQNAPSEEIEREIARSRLNFQREKFDNKLARTLIYRDREGDLDLATKLTSKEFVDRFCVWKSVLDIVKAEFGDNYIKKFDDFVQKQRDAQKIGQESSDVYFKELEENLNEAILGGDILTVCVIFEVFSSFEESSDYCISNKQRNWKVAKTLVYRGNDGDLDLARKLTDESFVSKQLEERFVYYKKHRGINKEQMN